MLSVNIISSLLTIITGISHSFHIGWALIHVLEFKSLKILTVHHCCGRKLNGELNGNDLYNLFFKLSLRKPIIYSYHPVPASASPTLN